MIRSIQISIVFLLLGLEILAQAPFDCLSQVWMLDGQSDRIVTMEINPSNNAIIIQPFIQDIGFQLDGLAFRSSDNFLYALRSEDKTLFRIDAGGTMQELATLNLPMDEDHDAFGITREGDRFVILGKRGNNLEGIYVFNFGNWDNPTVVPGTSGVEITDLSVNPTDGLFYGVNLRDGRIISFNPNTFQITGFSPPFPGDTFSLAYADAFGTVFAFGSSQFGVASSLFEIDLNDLDSRELTTGPESNMKEIAGCPFNVGLHCIVDPQFSFPCNEVTFSYSIANATGQVITDCTLESLFPTGFRFDELNANNIEGDIDFNDNEFSISDFEIPNGTIDLSFTVELSQFLDAGNTFSSFQISGLPDEIGNFAISDNPRTVRQSDETRLEIRVLDSDQIDKSFFFCTDVDAILDGSGYGTEYLWSTGSEAESIQVFESGIYSLVAETGCQVINVEFDVTLASCPFTIDLDHTIEPDSIFPCSELMYKFVVNNDSGTQQVGIDFKDTLDVDFNYVSLIRNPYGGENNSAGNILDLSDLTIPLGVDSIIFTIEIGSIDPGEYPNAARIENFPMTLGSFRLSDNPHTMEFDSTILRVLGTNTDTLFVPVTLCEDESVILDGTIYGTEFEWFNGSRGPEVEIDEVGMYELKVFAGCQESFVFFDVVEGEDIDVEIDAFAATIFLGDSILLEPQIFTESDTIDFFWRDNDFPVPCPECLSNYAMPLVPSSYTLVATNFVCSDSITVNVDVDNTRRLHVPNIFSTSALNFENQYFFIQSPDFGEIQELSIFDRYGSQVYSNNDPNFGTNRWDGRFGSSLAQSGVYVWSARIRFLDGLTETFTGSILLIN